MGVDEIVEEGVDVGLEVILVVRLVEIDEVGEVVALDVNVEDGDVVTVNVPEDDAVVVEDEFNVEVPDVVGLEVAVAVVV